jgi:hypothetical protein
MKILFFAAALVAQHCVETRFKEMQDDGLVVYEGMDEDTGKAMYTIFLADTTIEYAYEAEAMQYIKTGTFKYNDFLK